MATIIDFKDLTRRSPVSGERQTVGGTAQLILFTGVRYERRELPAERADTPRRSRKTAETTFDIQALGKDQYGQRVAAELAAKPKVQFLHLPFVKLKVARQKVAEATRSSPFAER